MRGQAKFRRVLHLKGLIFDKFGLLGIKPGGAFAMRQSFLKIDNLIDKMGFVKTGVVGIVSHFRFRTVGFCGLVVSAFDKQTIVLSKVF